jgi:DNA-binding NtrC family response regulator
LKTELELRTTERAQGNRPESHGSSTTTRKAVVIVDQQMMYRGHLRELIEREGYAPLTFSDAYRMVRYIEDNREDIKAVFIDFAIFTAIEKTLVSMISSEKSRVRLILTDTELSKERIGRLMERGVYGCVRKPYSEDEVASFLQ